jgi:glutamate--cysteine ligase
VANQGRKPGLMLNKNGEPISLQAWANQILTAMQPICALLDQGSIDKPYQLALQQQFAVVKNPALTPSAKILACMKENSQEFGCFATNTSALHKQYFKAQPLAPDVLQAFETQVSNSQQKQREIEANDQLSFDDFLNQYFAQS